MDMTNKQRLMDADSGLAVTRGKMWRREVDRGVRVLKLFFLAM